MRHNTAIVIPAIAILLFSFGFIFEPQNAYAGIDESENGNGNGNGEENAIWCEGFGEWESGQGFWKFRGDNEFWIETECLIILDFEETEVDVEIHGEFLVGDKIEDQCRDVTTELTIFIDDEGFEGTFEVVAEGEICRNGSTDTFQDLEIRGTGDFSNFVGEGTFTSIMERGGGDFEAEIHATLSPAEQNIIWCEGFGEWEQDGGFWKFGGDNEFFTETECLIIFDFEETEVFAEVLGQFLTGDKFNDRCREVTTELTIFIDDEGFEGTLELEAIGEICRNESTDTFQDLKIIRGTGDFSSIVGGEGTFTSVMERSGGDFEAEIHVTLVESTPTGSGSSYKNNQQPSVGVTETGNRVVDGGITVNGKTVDANFYFTPFPLIHSPIGQSIDFVFKIWDDRLDNIKHLQLQLGKGKIGESFTQVASATYDRNKMTGLVTVTHDPMFTNVVMEQLADQPCRIGTVGCTVIHVRLTPTQPIIGDVVWGLYIWDEAGNAVTIFFNEGIKIGTEADVVVVDDTIPKVIKKQLRTDDGWGNIDKRYSEAFKMKLAWHNEQVQKKVIELGYIF